ncbi:MAG TPA: glycosyltransferase family 2 protein [Candidatus Saccharimonadales bacterium]|nr:glycosyltransferase family 2 protein [Candidatus Saccharimonadales bacterium]
MDWSRILVTVPAYDEAESLPRVIPEIRAAAPGAPILVVDDCSADDTREVARRLGVTVASHPVNLGAGAAVGTGFLYALGRGFDLAVNVDGDGQHDPRYLGDVAGPVARGEADVAIGSRYVARTSYRAPVLRRAGMVVFSLLTTWLAGCSIRDTTSGYRAYSREVMRHCVRDLPHDFPDAPFLIHLARSGFRIVEVPVEMRAREHGRSFYTLGKSLYYPYKNLLASIFVALRVKRQGRKSS